MRQLADSLKPKDILLDLDLLSARDWTTSLDGQVRALRGTANSRKDVQKAFVMEPGSIKPGVAHPGGGGRRNPPCQYRPLN
jgi:hypothetical protein